MIEQFLKRIQQMNSQSSEFLLQYFGNQKYGLIISLISQSLFWPTSLFMKKSTDIPFEIFLFYRGFWGVFLQLIQNRFDDNINIEIGESFAILNLRSFLSYFLQIFLTYMIMNFELSLVYILYNTAPIFAFLIDYLLYGRKVSQSQIYWIFSSFFGLSIVLNPFQSNIQNFQGWVTVFTLLLYMLSIILLAYAWTLTKFIKNVTALDISFSLNLWIMIGTGVLMAIEGKTVQLTFQNQLQLFFYVGLPIYYCQILNMKALQIGVTGYVSIMSYCLAIYSLLFEIFIEQQPQHWSKILGTIILFVSLVKIILN